MAREVRNKPPVVLIVQPKATQRSVELALPADVRTCCDDRAMLARYRRYLASWRFDIDDPGSKKGDVMAVISAPDTDAEFEEAQANLNQRGNQSPDWRGPRTNATGGA